MNFLEYRDEQIRKGTSYWNEDKHLVPDMALLSYDSEDELDGIMIIMRSAYDDISSIPCIHIVSDDFEFIVALRDIMSLNILKIVRDTTGTNSWVGKECERALILNWIKPRIDSIKADWHFCNWDGYNWKTRFPRHN